jgi:hypothetical protein
MTRRSLLLVGTGLLLGTGFTVCHFGQGRKSEGDPEFARKWRQVFENVPDPDAAIQGVPEVVLKRYANGEWIFGVNQDSHQWGGGGTLVLKDNTGRVRVYFGHVCGKGCLEGHLARTQSLVEAYQAIQTSNFGYIEQPAP